MRRVVSVWFPHWPTDRLRRHMTQEQAASHEGPLVTALHDGRRRIIASADPVAEALGLRPGMAVAQALAIMPGLQIHEANPEGDASALLRLARWCHRTTPLTAIDPPDGLWLDVTGCAHLWGGEAAMLQALLDRMARDGLQARAAIADTPGAAHAMARFGDAARMVVPLGQHGAAVAPLPVACLRLPPDLTATLRRLGFEQVAHLTRIPRALLARRFSPLPGLRLDQMHGRVHEALQPILPEHILQHRTAFLEPLLTAEALAVATAYLVEPLCQDMERAGQGARQLDLLFERVDSHVAAIRIGTAKPSRDARHLLRLLTERLETIDPGLGVEAMRLVATLVDPLQWEQQEGGGGAQNLAPLVDRLTNRLGSERLYQASPIESEMPERSVHHGVPATTMRAPRFGAKLEAIGTPTPKVPEAAPEPPPCPPTRNLALVSFRQSGIQDIPVPNTPPTHLRLVEALTIPDPPTPEWKRPWAPRRMTPAHTRPTMPWPGRLNAPSRLLDPPRRVQAIAALPDQPPVAFTWRRNRHRICHADGPERIHGEWWRCNEEEMSVRDYFRVEDESGQRFWLFREGNGQDPNTGDLSWYLHGLF